MSRKPSNTREQCAFDRGDFKASHLYTHGGLEDKTAEQLQKMRDQRNPHKVGSVDHQFWNDGWDSTVNYINQHKALRK